MNVIDVHNHIGLSKRGTLGTAEELLQIMDSCGVTQSVIFSVDTEDSGETYQKQNDIILNLCEAHPKKFIALCRVQPKRTKVALTEIERCLKAGMKGIKLHPVSDAFFVDDCIEIFEYASHHKVPILIHSDHIPSKRPSHWEGAYSKYPNIDFILGHGGKDLFFEAGDLTKRYGNVYLDTSCLSYNRTRVLIETTGAEKILFGSDYPYSHPELEKRKFELLLEGKEEELKKVFCENARKVLKIT